MAKQRKTDKYRLIEGRGIGRELDYVPWIKTHDLSSKGWSFKILGWKIRRIYHLLSKKGELDFFLNTQWQDDVIDIREQYPIIPIDETITIANELGIKHPSIINKFGELQEEVMTTDFVITKKENEMTYDIARDIKMSEQLSKNRTYEKFRIVKNYWERQGIDWGVVTEKEIPHMKAYNLLILYYDYFWAEQRNIFGDELFKLIFEFKDKLVQNNFDVYNTVDDFDVINGWKDGESLNFFKFLLLKKEIITDFNKRLDFEAMNLWLPENNKEGYCGD